MPVLPPAADAHGGQLGTAEQGVLTPQDFREGVGHAFGPPQDFEKIHVLRNKIKIFRN